LKSNLALIYRKLYACFGPQFWWPAQSRFEVIVGAILTQNTSWLNVEKAIKNIKAGKYMSPKKLYNLPDKKLAKVIRPAGYYNIKARRLKNFLKVFLKYYRGSVSRMASVDVKSLREELLEINGIGPETADSVLLYALNRPVFVIDAYTRRIMNRLGFVDEAVKYNDLQACFHLLLPQDLGLYNDFHAQFVALGKDFCRPKPACSDCPLTNACQYY